MNDETQLTKPFYDQEQRHVGNQRVEDIGDKRNERTNLKAQMSRQEQRDRLKEIQKEYVELITQMHESDVTTKEWVTWLHFEVNMNTEKLDHVIAQNNTIIAQNKALIEMI